MSVVWLLGRASEVPAHDEWLAPEERATQSRFRLEKRRREWRLGRWTAKRLLLGVRPELRTPERLAVVAAEDGAPEAYGDGRRLADSISISHRGDLAVCATVAAPGVVGCDVERVEARSDRFVLDFFTADEVAALRAAPANERDLRSAVLWSTKEGALKVRRMGLRRDTRSVEVSLGRVDGRGWRRAVVHDREVPGPLISWWRPLQGYVLTVTLEPPSSLVVDGTSPLPLPGWSDGAL